MENYNCLVGEARMGCSYCYNRKTASLRTLPFCLCMCNLYREKTLFCQHILCFPEETKRKDHSNYLQGHRYDCQYSETTDVLRKSIMMAMIYIIKRIWLLSFLSSSLPHAFLKWLNSIIWVQTGQVTNCHIQKCVMHRFFYK